MSETGKQTATRMCVYCGHLNGREQIFCTQCATLLVFGTPTLTPDRASVLDVSVMALRQKSLWCTRAMGKLVLKGNVGVSFASDIGEQTAISWERVYNIVFVKRKWGMTPQIVIVEMNGHEIIYTLMDFISQESQNLILDMQKKIGH